MRLAFLIFRYFPFGGLQRSFLETARLCRARGHEVSAFTMEWAGEKPTDFPINLIKSSGLSNHKRALRFAQRILPVLSRNNFDLVVGFNKMPGLDLYYAGDPCYVERISRKYPHWKAALLRLTPRYKSFRWLESQVFSPLRATKILLLSEEEEQSYRQHYGTQPERFTILPPGISQDPASPNRLNGASNQNIREQLGIKNNQLVILLVGSAFQTKGLDRAIKAYSSLPYSLKHSSHLIAVGDIRIASFKKLARRLNIEDRVIFLPPIASVLELMQASDLLIHPSVCDSGGGVLLEAMTAGLPVLTTETCGYAKYVRQARAGIVIPSPFEQHNLNTALQEMLSSGAPSSWGENGRIYAEHQNFHRRNLEVVEIIEHTSLNIQC